MNKLIRCQMCGHEQEATRDGCVYDICGACGARIVRSQKPDALTERLVEAGNKLLAKLHHVSFTGGAFPVSRECDELEKTITEWQAMK